MILASFLAELDFFVYYHHPAWVEAFGRNILEALASGLPAILPPHFRPLFGDAAFYAEPAEVPSVLGRLYSSRAAYEDMVARAESSVRAPVRLRGASTSALGADRAASGRCAAGADRPLGTFAA